jgi:hypothetical protein
MGLCWFHHQKLHREEWVVTGNPNGAMDFALGARTYTSHPALPAAAA